MTSRAVRLLRGSLLGGVATLLAAVSHLAADGVAPSAVALLLGGVFAAAVGAVAVGRGAGGRPLSRARVVAGVGVAQLAFHLFFSLLGDGAAVAQAGGHHHVVIAITADAGAAVSQGGAAMWLAHLVAGVLTVLYLRHLESRLWALLERIGLRVTRALRMRAALPAASVAPVVTAAPRMRTARPLRGAIARRGPPAPLGA